MTRKGNKKDVANTTKSMKAIINVEIQKNKITLNAEIGKHKDLYAEHVFNNKLEKELSVEVISQIAGNLAKSAFESELNEL